MGVKNFSKLVSGTEIKLASLKGQTLALDASFLLWNAALGMNSVSGLTTSAGIPTVHISVLVSKIINMCKENIRIIVVFDHFDENGGHCDGNIDKQLEHAKRRAARQLAKDTLKTLKAKKTKEEELFSDTDDDETKEDAQNVKDVKYVKEDKKEEVKKIDNLQKKINQQEKRAFTINQEMISDFINILDMCDICYVVAPKDTEADAVCAKLTTVENKNIKCDAVFSGDSDIIPFNGKVLIRPTRAKGKKTLTKYVLADILEEKSITYDQFLTACIAMGTDFAKGVYRIGPKTVFKKLDSIELNDEQEKAKLIFQQPIDLSALEFHNLYKKPKEPESGLSQPLQDPVKLTKLLDWLADVKCFKRDRIFKQLKKLRPKLEFR